MIAIDANVLVQAQRKEASRHERALELLTSLAEGSAPWGLPSPCVGEYLRVVTHHRAWRSPTPWAEALDNIESLLLAPAAHLLSPTERHLPVLRDVLNDSGATGNRLYGAQIFAICLQHGVRELLTPDRDFRLFRGLKVTDPFAA